MKINREQATLGTGGGGAVALGELRGRRGSVHHVGPPRDVSQDDREPHDLQAQRRDSPRGLQERRAAARRVPHRVPREVPLGQPGSRGRRQRETRQIRAGPRRHVREVPHHRAGLILLVQRAHTLVSFPFLFTFRRSFKPIRTVFI